MNRHLFPLVAPLLACLSGCATIQPAPTASGRPEILVPGGREAVKQKFMAWALRTGTKIESESASQVVVSAPMQNLGAQLIYGSNFNRVPVARYRYTFLPEGSSTRVFSQGEVVTNPGSAFEQSTPVEQTDPKALIASQRALQMFRDYAAANP